MTSLAFNSPSTDILPLRFFARIDEWFFRRLLNRGRWRSPFKNPPTIAPTVWYHHAVTCRWSLGR